MLEKYIKIMAPLKSFDDMKAKYDSFMRAQNELTTHIKHNQLETDIYIERNLPVAILNLIKEVTEDGFSKSSDRRRFRIALKEKYKYQRIKIIKDEKADGLTLTCRLNKKKCEFPIIHIEESESDNESNSSS